MKKNNLTTFSLVFTGLMIAISVMLKFATFYIPIGGVPILRFDFFGPFEKLPAIFFGPIIGGISGALIDVIGYFLANKTFVFYIPHLTISAFFNVLLFALLWQKFKHVSNKVLERIYLIATILIGVFGIINTIYVTYFKTSSWAEFILNFANDQQLYFTIYCIICSVIGLILYIINKWILDKVTHKAINEYFFKLFIALAISGILFTTINTQILISTVSTLSNKSFILFLIPRLLGKIVEIFFDAYVLALLIHITRQLLNKSRFNKA
ncbi:MAG: ECF transporter S component [Eubacteriales bacterium]